MFKVKVFLISLFLSSGIFIHQFNNRIVSNIYQVRQTQPEILNSIKTIKESQKLDNWIFDNYLPKNNTKRKSFNDAEKDLISFFDSLPKNINPSLESYIYTNIDAIMVINFNYDLFNKDDVDLLFKNRYPDGIIYFKKIKIENGTISGQFIIFQPLILEKGSQ